MSNKIIIDDFAENYRDVVEIIGIDKAIELSKKIGGTIQYIPKVDALYRKDRNSKIRKEHTGFNTAELAIKHNLTEVQIRNIVSAKYITIENFLDQEE